MQNGSLSSPLSLQQLAVLVQETINMSFGRQAFWVVAEVMKVKYYAASQKYYFELAEKDPRTHQLTAKLDAHTWGPGTQAIQNFQRATGATFAEGQKYLMQVQVEFHPLYGLKAALVGIDSSFTIGAIARQRQEHLDQLLAEFEDYIWEEEGEYITLNKRLPQPVTVRNIAVIGSPQSDGYRDFVNELQGNTYGFYYNVEVFAALVQGNQAAGQLRQALAQVLNSHQPFDCVVFLRGGGAATDLSAFDNYELCAMAIQAPVPILTGIGHDRDETLLDLLVYQRCKTPTKVAAWINELNLRIWLATLDLAGRMAQQVEARLNRQQLALATELGRIESGTGRALAQSRQQLMQARHQVGSCAASLLNRAHRQLDQQGHQLQSLARNQVQQQRHQLERLHWLLQTNSPAFQQQRGYFRLQQNNQPVTSLAQIDPSQPALLTDASQQVQVAFNSPIQPL